MRNLATLARVALLNLAAAAVVAAMTPSASVAQAPPATLGGQTTIAATSSSARTALPASGAVYVAVTLYNSGAKDAWFKLGDSSVVATTSPTGVGAGKIPAQTTITVAVGVPAATNIALVTGGSDTTTVELFQGSGPMQFGRAGAGGGGGGITSLSGDVVAAGPGAAAATLATSQPSAHTWAAAQTITLNGAAAPAPVSGAALHVVGADGVAGRVQTTSFGTLAAFSAARANGTGASPSGVLAGNQIGGANAYSYVTAATPGFVGPVASFQTFATQDHTTTALGSKIVLATTPNGSATLAAGLTVDQDQSVTAAGSFKAGVGSFMTSTGPGGALTALAYAAPGAGVAAALGNAAGGAGGFALVGATPPTGTAGGDLGGSYPNPTLAWVSRAASQTLNIGAGGTLGSNAFTSTAYLPLGGGTMSGTIAMGGSNISGGGTATFTSFVGALTGNASTVTTNANLAGVITSVGNTTSIASQTGTGTKFVVDTNPVLVGPTIGVAIGTSLALGGGSIGSDAFEVTGTTTHNGNLSVVSGGLITSGNLSAAAWTTNGIRAKMAAASYTDTTSSGTVATAYTDLFGASTILASSATTYTNYYGVYFVAPVASTNVTMTNKSALGADSISIGGQAQSTFALAVNGTSFLNGAVTFPSGANISSGGSLGAGSSSTVNWVGRGILTSPAAGSTQTGAADVDTNASIVAQTTRSQGALAGGTADQAGKNWTFIASPGKGTGAGGSFIFQTTPAGSTGTVVGTPTTVLTMDSTQKATFSGEVDGASFVPTSSSVPANGMYLSAANTVSISSSSSRTVTISNSNGLFINNANAASLPNATASSTTPTLVPNRNDGSTGIGAQASGNISLIAVGAEQIRIAASGVITFPTVVTDATKTDATACFDTTTGQIYKGSGTLGVCLGTSSARFKKDIAPLEAGLAQIMAVQPVRYRTDAQHGDPDKVLYGFTAEQAGAVLPALMGRDKEDRPNTFDYLGMVPVLVRAVQELKADNDNLRAELRTQRTGTR